MPMLVMVAAESCHVDAAWLVSGGVMSCGRCLVQMPWLIGGERYHEEADRCRVVSSGC